MVETSMQLAHQLAELRHGCCWPAALLNCTVPYAPRRFRDQCALSIILHKKAGDANDGSESKNFSQIGKKETVRLQFSNERTLDEGIPPSKKGEMYVKDGKKKSKVCPFVLPDPSRNAKNECKYQVLINAWSNFRLTFMQAVRG